MADKKHTRILGDKTYIATTVGNGCVLCASIATDAGEESLVKAYGVFTYYLLEGLKGATDADGDKLITAGEAYEYVFKNVSRHTQNMQHPIKKGEEERPIILGVIK